MKLAKALLCIFSVGLLLGQNTATIPTPLQVTRIFALGDASSLSNVVDNRSALLRKNNNHGFCATGTGTWSVTMQFSTTATGPWTSFGSSAVVTNVSSSCVGFGLGSPNFISFAVVGSASADYTAWKNLYVPSTTTATSFPILTGQGGTGTATTFTLGSTVFAGVGGVYTQDNANYFWENTAKRLRIGNSSPAVPHDTAQFYIEHTSTATSNMGLDILFTGNSTGVETNFNRAIDINFSQPVNLSSSSNSHAINVNGYNIANGQLREYGGVVSFVQMVGGTSATNTHFAFDGGCSILAGQPKGNCFGAESVVTNLSTDNNPSYTLGGMKIVAAAGVLDKGMYWTQAGSGSWRRGIDANDITSFSDDFIYAPTRQLSWNAQMLLKNTLFMNFVNASMEIGSLSAVNAPAVDLHSSGNNIDYDVRLTSTGGTGLNGNGKAAMISDSIQGPGQYRALAYATASQALTTAVWTSLAFDIEDFDVGSLHDTVVNTSRFTVPTGATSGVYTVTGQCMFTANATGIRAVRVVHNGAIVRAQQSFMTVTTGIETFVNVNAILQLNSGDFVEIQGYQTSGVAVNCVNGIGATFGAVARLW